MGKLPMDFVAEVYKPEYTSGWMATAKYLCVWYDGEIHVWDLCEEGLVHNIGVSVDPAHDAIDMWGDVDTPEEYLTIVRKYL